MITWSTKVRWQIKYLLSLLPQALWSPNLKVWLHTLRNFYPVSYMTFWLRAAFRSRDKFKTFYHYLQKKYWHQTRQGGDLQEKLPTLKWRDLLTSLKNHYFYGLLMVFSITKKNTKFNLMSWNAKYVSAKLLRKAWSTKKKKKISKICHWVLQAQK